MPKLSVLDNIRIASPCTASWSTMQGDDFVRFCPACRLNVYNISALSRPEAESLFLAREGRLCLHTWQRPDGTIITQDCPIGLRRVRCALAKSVLAVGSLLGLAFTTWQALGLNPTPRLRVAEPFARLAAWLAPRPSAPPPGAIFVDGTPVALPSASSPACPNQQSSRCEPDTRQHMGKA